jgi:hypothetical protein
MCGQVVANDDLDVLPGQRLDMAQENLMKGSKITKIFLQLDCAWDGTGTVR